MDVRLYPSAPAVGARPGAEPAGLAHLDYYHCGKFDGDSAYVGMSDGNPELLPTSQTYNSQSESNEDYEIPPITPPNLPEPSLLHLGDHEASYHSLCHGLAPNGLLPAYSYQAMDLPAIMVSNMLAQDSHLLSGQLPTDPDVPITLCDPQQRPKAMGALNRAKINSEHSGTLLQCCKGVVPTDPDAPAMPSLEE